MTTGARNDVSRKKRLPMPPREYDEAAWRRILQDIEKFFNERESRFIADSVEAITFRDRTTGVLGGITATVDAELFQDSTIWRLGTKTGDTNTITAVTSTTFTVNTSVVGVVFFDSTYMNDRCFVQVTNTTRSEKAWIQSVSNVGSDYTHTVHESSDISNWQVGDTVQIGDADTNLIPIDYSPLLIDQFGQPFKARAVMLDGFSEPIASPVGTTGTQRLYQRNDTSSDATTLLRLDTAISAGGGFIQGFCYISQVTDSPISDSRLLYLTVDSNSNFLEVRLKGVVF